MQQKTRVMVVGGILTLVMTLVVLAGPPKHFREQTPEPSHGAGARQQFLGGTVSVFQHEGPGAHAFVILGTLDPGEAEFLSTANAFEREGCTNTPPPDAHNAELRAESDGSVQIVGRANAGSGGSRFRVKLSEFIRVLFDSGIVTLTSAPLEIEIVVPDNKDIPPKGFSFNERRDMSKFTDSRIVPYAVMASTAVFIDCVAEFKTTGNPVFGTMWSSGRGEAKAKCPDEAIRK